jgi:hypothetical protein
MILESAGLGKLVPPCPPEASVVEASSLSAFMPLFSQSDLVPWEVCFAVRLPVCAQPPQRRFSLRWRFAPSSRSLGCSRLVYLTNRHGAIDSGSSSAS